jgi:hypothetical protein
MLGINFKVTERDQDVKGFISIKSIEASKFINLSSAKLLDEHLADASGTYHYISNGKVSSYQMINYFLDRFKEPATLHVTTWGMTELALRQMATRKASGMIKDIYFVFSEQIKVNKANEYQLATSIAGGFKKHPCHAKIYLIKSDSYQVSIITSANLNRNNKMEAGSICFDKNIYQGFSSYLNELINGN